MPPADKRRRLNTLLSLQERIGSERNQAWLGRDVEVLVDAVVPPRSHEHDAELSEGVGEGVRLSGRTRYHRLVHLNGEPSLVGRFVTVRVEHAGPYALRGTVRPN